MHAALTRTGYHTSLTCPGRHWALLVTGWDGHALEARLAAMRTVIAQLSTDPTATAATVIDRYRHTSARSPGSRLGIAVLIQAGEELRASVAARCGIHAPRDPAILPADTGNALRLRAVWVLEQAIDDLIGRHLRIARRALCLFRALRPDTTDDRAQDAAIRRAVGFAPRPSGSTARGRTVAAAPPLWPPRPAAPPAARGQASRSRAGPAQQATLGFPMKITDVVTTVASPMPRPARPPVHANGGAFPGRPGHSR